MALLKDIYSPEFYYTLGQALAQIIPTFDQQKFIQYIFDEQWENKELKQRMKHTASVLSYFLPEDFKKAASVIKEIIFTLRENNVREQSLEYMFFPDYIETYGINDFDVSVDLMELATQFTSCEFAVRPFIIKYENKMINKMLEWSTHESHHVRRLASEGSRPRLPWAIAIPALKKDPTPILPVIENLKNDPSEYVRRSVANNLNDIAKDHPALVISIAKKWKGVSRETDAIIKHGCRTLLKKGDPEVYKFYNLDRGGTVKLSNLNILTPVIKIGDQLTFSFDLQNKGISLTVVRIEYAIHYPMSNGKHSKKVFKISERSLAPKSRLSISRKHSFKKITTRKFYAGRHKVSVIVNGKEQKSGYFELL